MVEKSQTSPILPKGGVAVGLFQEIWEPRMQKWVASTIATERRSFRYSHTCDYRCCHLHSNFMARLWTNGDISCTTISSVDKMKGVKCLHYSKQEAIYLALFFCSWVMRTRFGAVRHWVLECKLVTQTSAYRSVPLSKWPHISRSVQRPLSFGYWWKVYISASMGSPTGEPWKEPEGADAPDHLRMWGGTSGKVVLPL